MRRVALLPIIALSACSAPGGPYPSLQPRAAEAIDPRVPVSRPVNDRPTTPALVGRLSGLVGAARSGDSAFDGAASQAERLPAPGRSAATQRLGGGPGSADPPRPPAP